MKGFLTKNKILYFASVKSVDWSLILIVIIIVNLDSSKVVI